MADFYNNEGYASPTEYEAFTHIEREEKAAAKNTGSRRNDSADASIVRYTKSTCCGSGRKA